ncbi:MAG: Holliday junction resolvase RuvX [bacterium]
MKLLALDYGTKRIGLALGDTADQAVVPYGFIENKGDFFVLGELKKICDEEDVDVIVIGVPEHKELKGVKEIIKKFIAYLKENINIEIDTADEKFTSKIASQDARYEDLYKDRSKGWKDARAAEEILRGYLEKF